MVAENTTILIMAAGTGGHVFPALSIARKLAALGVRTEWLGTRKGMENELLADTGITVHQISAKGLRGKGAFRILLAPFMIAVAVIQSMRVISRVKPDCVLGMGGFVSGPGGIATKIMGRHLLIHEQNAVAGVTNRILARFADCVFEAFPHTFAESRKVVHTGNPVREDIVELERVMDVNTLAARPLRLLILGGSQGANAINRVIPEVLAAWNQSNRPEIWHQTGKNTVNQTRDHYRELGIEFSDGCVVEAFIEDMAQAYSWADLVICRSGASTVSELAVAGLASVLIPYPHHADKQQLVNARWLADADAAFIVEQADLSAELLSKILVDLNSNREQLLNMSQRAKALAICNASDWIAQRCLEVANG